MSGFKMNRAPHSSVAERPGQTREWRLSSGRGAPRPRDRRSTALLAAAIAALLAPATLALSEPYDDSLDSVAAAAPVALGEVLPAIRQPFRPGERLRFSVQYGPIHAGTAWLEVHGGTSSDGRSIDTLVARAESNPFFFTYRVRNRIESAWDATQQMSDRYREDRHEGGFRAHDVVTFDHEHGEAHYENGLIFPIPPRVQDALSSFYYTRLLALPVGGSVYFDYHASHRSQPLEVRVIGRDRVHVPAGTFDCVIVEPVLRAGGIFKHNGRLLIWLSADERRWPVLMKSKVMIGSISVVLQEARAEGG